VQLERAVARDRRGLLSSDAQEKFVEDFVAAWTKVMNPDRFDLASGRRLSIIATR